MGQVEQQRAIAHRTGERMVDDHAVPAFAHQGRQRYTAARRLQADKSGAGGRHTDRAAAIGGMRHRHDAGCDQCCRTARRAAAGMAGVPRIAGDAKGPGFGHQSKPVLRRCRGDDRDKSGSEIAVGQRRIDIGQPCRNAAAAMRRHALDGDAEILDGEGNTSQRQRGVDGLGAGAGGIVERFGRGIDVGTGGLGAGNRGVGQFDGRNLALADQIGEAGGIFFPKDPFDRHARSPINEGKLASGNSIGNRPTDPGRRHTKA